MSNMMKKFICAVGAVAAWAMAMPPAMMAAESDAPNAFVVWTADGEKVSFLLSDSPVTTFSDTDIIITSATTQVEYSKTGVAKFTLERIDTSLSPSVQATTGSMTRQAGAFVFENFAPHTAVCLSGLGGTMVYSGTMSAEGSLTLPTSGLAAGIYIIKAGDKSYKFTKK